MGAKIIVETKDGDINYEFDVAKDGEEFKKDLEKEWKKNGIKRTITIKKTKDIKTVTKGKKRYYDNEMY